MAEIAPDGTRIAFVAGGSEARLFYSAGPETTAIQVLALDEPGAVPTTLIEGASNPG